MFKDIYAVCIDSNIKDEIPGYYAVVICEDLEDAKKIKEDINSYLENTPEDDNFFDKLSLKRISFGYYDKLNSKAYIKKIKMVMKNKSYNFIKYTTHVFKQQK